MICFRPSIGATVKEDVVLLLQSSDGILKLIERLIVSLHRG
jgi:hypothetical protein